VGPRSLRTALLLLVVAVGSLVAAQTASAGTYTVNACSPTSSAGGWQPVNTFPSGLTVGNMCGGPASGPNEPQGPTDEGALFAQDGPSVTAETPNGVEGGWSFTAPTGTSIISLTYWRSLHAYDQQSLVPGLWTGEGATLESCQSPPEGTHECNDLNNQGPKTFTNLNAASLFFGVRCSLVGGGEYCASSGGADHFAQADLYSASITLSEASAPIVSSVTGAGWSGGYVSGQVPITLSASDDSGIASVEVRSSLGAVLASAPQVCDYYLPVPCPDLSSATLELNTTAAAEGSQTLILTVTDAARNITRVTSQPVVIDNSHPTPPPPPQTGPSPSHPGGSAEGKLRALIDSRGRLYVAGPIPKGVNSVRVCWRSMRGKRTLGSRCVTLHVEHGRIAVTFHPSARARRGHITVTISRGHGLIARLMSTKAHST
jgi:hypothetical protein